MKQTSRINFPSWYFGRGSKIEVEKKNLHWSGEKVAGREDTKLMMKEVDFTGELTGRSEANKSNKLSKLILRSWGLKLKWKWKTYTKVGRKLREGKTRSWWWRKLISEGNWPAEVKQTSRITFPSWYFGRGVLNWSGNERLHSSGEAMRLIQVNWLRSPFYL